MTDSNKEEIITRQVLDAHGELKDLKEIRLYNVFDNKWRINVWCYYENESIMSIFRPATIKYSYFVHVDDACKILKSCPKLG
jgi:hypothetical protein|tara:strand:+ start:116 stop:361 length:246 start_codon:yes stop_codon:yes gene_type:complete